MTDVLGMERLTEKLWKSSQSWNYEALYSYKECKLKVDIKRDAYDNQSYFRIKIFDADAVKWNVLATNSMTKERHVFDVSYVSKEPQLTLFQEDASELVAEARLVLDDQDNDD